METIAVVGIIAFGGLLVSLIGYTTMTDSVIKDQKREIARLRNENRKLEAALIGKKCLKNIGTEVNFKEW